MTIDEIKRQIFIDSEEVCGNTMIDIYQAEEYVEQAYNKAIDDFADKFISLCDDGEFMARLNEFSATTILELAEQLKAGDRECTEKIKFQRE